MVPEQIVGDEDVVADRREVLADRRRSTARGRRGVQLPDRAERTAERTAARRLDQPRRPVREARVLPAPARRRGGAAGSGTSSSARRRRVAAVRTHRAVARPRLHEPGNRRRRGAPLERLDRPRHRPLAVVEHDRRRRRRVEERRGIRGGGVSADDDRHVGRSAPHARDERQHVVGLERVHAGDADERRAAALQVVLDRTAEPQIGERDAMPAGFERGGDVFHAERLDAEERTEPEPFVAGTGRSSNTRMDRRHLARTGSEPEADTE